MQLQVTGEHFVSEVSKKITWRLDHIPKKFYNLVKRMLLTAVKLGAGLFCSGQYKILLSTASWPIVSAFTP